MDQYKSPNKANVRPPLPSLNTVSVDQLDVVLSSEKLKFSGQREAKEVPASSKHKSKFRSQWKQCLYCKIDVKSPSEFALHLREQHCTREGGSFVCRFGSHGVCPSLPLEGVSDRDYELHVAKEHVGDEAHFKKVKRTLFPEMAEASTPVTTAPSVVTDKDKWTVYSSTVNLPAVLNDPRKTRRETDFFTKIWGDTFVEKASLPSSPYVQEITRIHFERYLRKTARKLKTQHKQFGSADVQNAASFSTGGSQHQLGVTKARESSELGQVPKIFFRNEFHLENPETFESVLPWSQFKGKQSSKLLQEKLSHYLDLVEVHIAKEISVQSNAFFTAMASHDKLQEDLKTTCAAIKNLRVKMLTIDDVLSKNSLDILKLKVSRANYTKVYNKLKLMSTVHQTQPTIQLLLSTSEFVGALDLISTTQEVLSQELAGVQSFRHLGSQLIELEKLIDKMLLQEFSTFATMSLNSPLDEETQADDEKLSGIVFGMLRQRKFDMLDTYKEEAFSAIKMVIKQTVVDAVSVADNGDADTVGASLAEQMRLLNFNQWLSLFSKVFENLLKLLKRVKTTCKTIQNLINTAAGRCTDDEDETPEVPSPPCENGEFNGLEDEGLQDNDDDLTASASALTLHETKTKEKQEEDSRRIQEDILIASGEHSRLTSGLRDMLAAICDYSHDRCLKLLLARGKDGFLERLNSTEFVTLSRTVESFVSKCEKISGRRSSSLHGGLQNQANKFVNRFHEERKNKLGLILDSERWKQADVPAGLQDLLSSMSKGNISLDLLARTSIDSGERKPNGSVRINDEKFAVVGTVLLLLKMVAEYCQCVEDMPTAAADILTRLVEILQIFNSRSCQLILGAGALQLVGLKTITTKNLALTSRCLQLIALYIPIVRDYFAERLSERQHVLLKNMDKICKDYNDHVQEIHNKLVAIMDDSSRQCLSQWEVKAPVPSACFREICKRNKKFYEAISVLLPSEQVKVLFLRINVSFKSHLKEQLKKLNVCNDGGPKHGLVTSDLHFYLESMNSLNGMKDVVEDPMDDIWDWR